MRFVNNLSKVAKKNKKKTFQKHGISCLKTGIISNFREKVKKTPVFFIKLKLPIIIKQNMKHNGKILCFWQKIEELLKFFIKCFKSFAKTQIKTYFLCEVFRDF